MGVGGGGGGTVDVNGTGPCQRDRPTVKKNFQRIKVSLILSTLLSI